MGYLFGKENSKQNHLLQIRKIALNSEKMQFLMKQDRCKLVNHNKKIKELQLLLTIIDTLVHHVEAKSMTPKLWGINIDDLTIKAIITAVLAVVPSVVIRLDGD